MVSLFKYCYLIVAIFVCGDVVNSICFKDKSKSSLPLRFSIAYGLGTGTLGLLIFYLSYLGGTINFKNAFFLSLPFIAYFIYSTIKDSKDFQMSIVIIKSFKDTFRKGMLDYFFLVLIIVSISIIIFRALYLPKHMADDRAQWGIKAKILYHEGTIYADDFFDPSRVMYHARYPFLVPLLESFFYGALGEMNDSLVKIPFPLFFIALVLFFYASQRRFSNNRHALMFTSMMSVLPIFIRDIRGNPASGYADFPLTFYYTISAFSLLFWIEDHKREDLLMATICIIFSIFTKREGVLLWAIAIFGLLLYFLLKQNETLSKKVLLGGIFIVVPLIFLLPWFHFSSTVNRGPWEKDFQLSYLTYEYIHSHLYRVPVIMKAFLEMLFTPHYFNVIWILFFITIAFSFKDSFCFPQAFLLLLVILNIASLLFAIVVYPWFWWGNFLHDMPRLLMINVPLMIYALSFQFHRGKFLKPFV